MPYARRSAIRLLFAGSLLSFAAACGDDTGTSTEAGGTIPVATVRVLPETLDVFIGGQTRLVAEPRAEDGVLLEEEAITWTVSDTTVASVDPDGNVIAVGIGSAEVRASSGERSGSSRVRVRRVPVNRVEVTPAVGTVEKGKSITYVAQAYSAQDSLLTDRVTEWKVAATHIASVDQEGRVTGLITGHTIVRAEIEGKYKDAEVRVVAAAPGTPGTVGDLRVPSVNDTTATLRFTEVTDGAGAAADYEMRYAQGTSITWDQATPVTRGSCSSPIDGSSAGATRTCVISGLAPATAYRVQVRAFRGTLGSTAVHGPVSNIASVTTTTPPAQPAPVATVTVSPSSDTLNVGQASSFTATLRDSSGNVLSGRSITWSSTNTTVATVSSTGVVTARVAGTATIRATSEGRSGSAAVLVVAPPPAPVASVTVTPNTGSVQVGANVQFSATLRDANGNVLSGRTVTWSSTNTSVATVATNGVATGRAEGTTTIRATSEGQVGTATLTVTAVTPPPTGSGAFTNAPGSFRTLTDWHWSTHNGGGWSYEGENPHTHSYMSVVSSGYGSAPPSGGTNVLQATYLAGARGGFGPGRTNYAFSGGRNEVFVGMWHKFPADFIASDNSNKMFFFYIGSQRAFLGFRDRAADSPRRSYNLTLDGFGPTPGVAIPSNPRVLIPFGEWYKIEWHVKRNTPGTNDGFMRVWINGTLTHDVRGLSFPGSMSMFYVEGVHNGINDSNGDRYVPEEMNWWLARSFISAP